MLEDPSDTTSAGAALRQALQGLGLSDLEGLFAAQDVEADMLDALTEAQLREIGLSLGQRTRVLRALDARRAGAAAGAEAAPEPGRRQLTALFCDLVGSTRLSTLLDPEDLRDVLTRYQTAASGVMRAHGGHIAYAQGDGLMVYFGFPLAGEDDAERALRAGLELTAAISRLQTPAPEPLRLRVGVATGVVVVGGPGEGGAGKALIVGETPNLAARLQTVAEPGEVVLSDSTRRLCGAMYEYEARGAVEVKGFDEPVPVFRVLGESGAGRFVGHTAGGLNPLVGRAAERAALHQLWQAAAQGAGGVALVGGEPGIGKSRLAHAFAADLDPGAAQVIAWHAAAHLANRPLHPVLREVEAAAGLTRDMDDAARRAALGAWVGAGSGTEAGDLPWFGDLLGIASLQVPGLDPKARARNVQDAVLRRFSALARRRPVVLLIEDLHWADTATLDLLAALIPLAASLPMMLVMTHRPHFTPPWQLPDGTLRLALDGIGPEEALRLLTLVARGREVPVRLADAIVQKAGGVPLFVEELTKTLVDAPETAQKPGALAIPATLQDSLMARLDRMGGAKELAQLASVLGRDFSVDMLRLISPRGLDVMAGLRALCNAGLTQPLDAGGVGGAGVGGETFGFHHALIQDTAYESLLKSRRRDIHRQVAERILGGSAAFARTEPEIIARHCAVAGMHDEAARFWALAGTQAADRAAAEAAVSCLTEALHHLEQLPPGRDRSKAELDVHLVLLPAVMHLHGRTHPQVRAVGQRAQDLAIEVGDAKAVFAARWGRWATYLLGGRFPEAFEEERILARIAEDEDQDWMRLSVHHTRGFDLYSVGDFRGVVATLESGRRFLTDEAEQGTLRAIQISSGTSLLAIGSAALWYLGEWDAAERVMAETTTRAAGLNHLPNLVQATTIISYQILYAENWDRLSDLSQRMLHVSQEHGLLYWQAVHQMHLAFCNPGAPEMAAEVGAGVLDRFSAMGNQLTHNTYEPFVARALIAIGTPAEAERRLSRRIENCQGRGETNNLPEVLRMRGEAWLALGDAAAAAADFAAALQLAQTQHAVAWIVSARRSLDALHAAHRTAVVQ